MAKTGISVTRTEMPKPYADYQFRLEVCSPVAADSPFDSDTLWGRILCTLFDGSRAETDLATQWVAEINESGTSGWDPPLLISEGFQCDAQGVPWLPIPLAAKLTLEQQAALSKDSKAIKTITRLPLLEFFRVCQGAIPSIPELLRLRESEPSEEPVLHPHVAIDRGFNTGIDGQFHMLACNIYSPFPRTKAKEKPAKKGGAQHRQAIAFFVRLRRGESRDVILNALRCVCQEGWGKAKSRGLGRIRFESFEPCQLHELSVRASAFVSLSHFCPASNDPTEGFWKLQTKDPVPPQFVNGKRLALGEKQQWRVKSFLRLQAGSCFRLAGEQPLRSYYGRFLANLINPAEDGVGKLLPALFHYALAFPVPIKWPEDKEP